jgi:hypothetical protein
MSKFKVGDEVQITSSSEYYGRETSSNPKDVIGEVRAIFPDRDLCVEVDWPGDFNGYTEEDLELVEENPCLIK